MKILTQQDIKRSEIETLRIFRDFCDKNHLRYYLAFGTLLGAVRHKGFIPWDDDVDVFMPRPDYNHLIAHFNDADQHRREVVSRQNTPDFYLNSAKIIDRNTVVQETERSLAIGVWIDVFPMDLLPENALLRRWAVYRVWLLNFLIAHFVPAGGKTRAWYKKLLFRLWRLVRPPKSRLEALLKKEMKKLERNLSGSYYGLLYKYFWYAGTPIFPVSDFEPSVKLEFEGEHYDAPAEYDKLLRLCYGDYTSPPPAELQKSRHSCICYWDDASPKEQK